MRSTAITILALFLFSFFAQAQPGIIVSSPDKSLVTKVAIKNGQVFYSVSRNKEVVIKPSLLGIAAGTEDFSRELSILRVSGPLLIDEKYRTLNAKKSRINYKASQLTVVLKNGSGKQMHVIFRMSNDAVAFRYYFPWVSRETQITNELTSFVFSKDTKAWLQPMSEAKTGWEHCHPSYEEHYLQDIPVGTVSPLHSGWVYPALFKTNNNWVLITEAGMDGTYCGTRLINDSASSIYHVGFPDPREVFTGKGYLPLNDKPWYTPWRIIVTGNLKTIAESTAGTDLAKRQSKWIPPSFAREKPPGAGSIQRTRISRMTSRSGISIMPRICIGNIV